MAFTEFRFDAEAITDLVAENAAKVKANKGMSDYAGFLAGIYRQRLEKNGPGRYLDYGPYWWAVKDVLKRAGMELGEEDDAELREAYSGATDAETLVMADLFRELYLKKYFIGNRQYQLTETGETWTISDEDMESLAFAAS